MGLFKQREGDCAVLVMSGVYHQVDVYERDGYIYAKMGNGFVRLMADGSTSKATCRLDHLMIDAALYRDVYGKLCTDAVPRAKALPPAQKVLLLGSEDEA